MTEEISYSNYLYQGQVYSPAFSDPPSPSSPMSTSSDTVTTASIQSDSYSPEEVSVEAEDMSPIYNEETPSSSSNASVDAHTLSSIPSSTSDKRGSEQTVDNSAFNNRKASHAFNHSSQNSFSALQGSASKPRYPTKYHKMLQPLSPVTTLPVEEVIRRPLPNRTHVTEHDQQLQKQFHCLVESATDQVSNKTTTNNSETILLARVNSLEEFLIRHSENIDVNQYNSDGQTALQQGCLAGNLPLVKLLVRFGSNMRLTTREGFSILHIAAFSGSSDLLTFVMGQQKIGR